MCFIHNLSHSRQANRRPNKFYLNANFHIELDPHKLQHLFNQDSAITIPAGRTYFYELAEKSVKIYRNCRSTTRDVRRISSSGAISSLCCPICKQQATIVQFTSSSHWQT